MFKKTTLLVLVLILFMQVVLFIPYIKEPFERDEGSYGYVAQRLLLGELPYRDVFDHKPPGVYFIYAGVFKLFGDNLTSIRVFTLGYSLLTTLAVFAVGLLLLGNLGGLLAAFFYGFYCGGPYIQGTSANTETFMVLPMLLALYCFLLAVHKKEGNSVLLFLSGLFSGLAMMIKQVSLPNFLVLFAFSLYLAFQKPKRHQTVDNYLKRHLVPSVVLPLGATSSRGKARCSVRRRHWTFPFGPLMLLLGFMIFPLLFILYFWLKGGFPDFIDGVILYNLAYAAEQRWVWPRLFRIVIFENSLLWILSIFSIFYILIRDRKLDLLLLALWVIFSFVGVCMGRTFYGHYFIQVIPGLALLSAYGLLRLKENIKKLWLAAIVCILLTLVFAMSIIPRVKFHLLSPEEISIKKYGITYFALAPQVAGFIKQNAASSDEVFVWGSEGEVYFYSQRKAASKYFYNYPLLYKGERAQRARLRMLDDIKVQKPKYVIWVHPGAAYDKLIKYLKANYEKEAVIDKWLILRRKK
ncbi:MAG: glycosyltransferase family 39 protein [Candidatus Saganbacteria bacterium]|nr:glycosyltransferase family 39 protein [Candidatus Saganbacteria bacterium]